ncbi:MAG: formylglycine-generating enzyme family protein [Candidatus Competibacteraceae bacterium]
MNTKIKSIAMVFTCVGAINIAANVYAAGELEPEMVAITGGCFQMGSPANEPDRRNNEDQHEQVCVKGFEIGRYEVTQRQWQAVITGYNFLPRFKGCLDCPIDAAPWDLVQDYLRKLNQQTGKKYRLPTEAEWEYACRGGAAGQRYCGGDNPDRLAWYRENSSGKTHPVGQKTANGFGLYDMSGNVSEWTCSAYDWDGANYGDREKECTDEDAKHPVFMRGGSWSSEPAELRSANRGQGFPGLTINDNGQGFRLARSL